MPHGKPRRSGLLRWSAALLLATAPVASSFAATATTTFGVHMTIEAGCTIESATDLNFGTISVLSASIDVASAISVRCSNTTSYAIGLDKGQHGATVTARQMQGGPTNERINYTLTSNAGRTINWGNTVGSDTLSGTGNGSSQVFQVYGRVPPQATPTAGTYSDIVTVTVTY